MRTSLITVAAALALASPLAAQTGFDDIPGGYGTAIPSGYLGFTWTNFYALDGCGYSPSSGYCTGTVSSPNVVLNGFGTQATISRPGDPFYFDGGQFTAAWNDGLTIHVEGFLGLDLLFSHDIIVNTAGPFDWDAEWDGIDKLTFDSYGGIDANQQDEGTGTHFVLDDLQLNGTVSVTPEPATMTLLATGLVGMAGAARRRRTKIQK